MLSFVWRLELVFMSFHVQSFTETWRSPCLQSFARKSLEILERCWCRTVMLHVESTGSVKRSWHRPVSSWISHDDALWDSIMMYHIVSYSLPWIALFIIPIIIKIILRSLSDSPMKHIKQMQLQRQDIIMAWAHWAGHGDPDPLHMSRLKRRHVQRGAAVKNVSLGASARAWEDGRVGAAKMWISEMDWC